ncbi:MAG: site-specific integrase, partial [Alistipes sp.]|nr:site-specific integrase [Alistipes sp.]
MERKTFSVVFFCKKTKVTRKGKAPIYVRITTSGRSTEIYTQCQIEPERWNQKAERSMFKDRVSVQINDILTTCRANVLQAYDQLIKEGKEPNCFAIKHRLLDPRAGSKMFLEELELYCEKRQKEVGVRITQLTANKYHRMLRYLREYTLAEYRK